MDTRQNYIQWLEKSKYVANLKLAIAVQSFALVMGTMLVTNSRSGEELGSAVMFAGYLVFCGFLANFKYRLACTLVAIPNLVLATILLTAFVFYDSEYDAIAILWLLNTSLVGIVALILSRVSGVPSQSERPVNPLRRDE